MDFATLLLCCRAVEQMEEMLEHMVSMMKTLQAEKLEDCRKQAIQSVETKIAKDAKLQQRSIGMI